MLLSRVALGKTVKGSSDLRRPPEGSDSCTHSHSMGHRHMHSHGNHMDIYCVYDNAQAYPEYIITYNAARHPSM